MAKYIAIDLGASNGRVVVGDLEHIEVVHRFVTKNEQVLGEVYWDLPYIFSEIKRGLKEAFSRYQNEIVSIGIDTWGVDYALIDNNGSLVSLPYHYRDSRTDGMIRRVCRTLGRNELYERTGIAFHQFNTIYQLAAMKRMRPKTFVAAEHYLSIPDVLTYWLTQKMTNEVTHASTTQLYNPWTGTWDWESIDKLRFPRKVFGSLVKSGTIVGPLLPSLCTELGAPKDVAVVAVGTHDTASAVAAVPAKTGEEFLYISSGTWSLLGIEVEKPIITQEALKSGFTNEVAVNGNIRFLKNIMGMWIQQECVRYWESQGQHICWEELDAQTLACASYPAYIDPDDQRYLKPNSPQSLMVDRVRRHCVELGFDEPKTPGEFMVAIYRGLAIAYAASIDQLQRITGKHYSALHVIGGGCKNTILNQWTADETDLHVYAGPAEATALGNILVQSMAMGEIGSLQEGRDLVAKSQTIHTFTPTIVA